MKNAIYTIVALLIPVLIGVVLGLRFDPGKCDRQVLYESLIEDQSYKERLLLDVKDLVLENTSEPIGSVDLECGTLLASISLIDHSAFGCFLNEMHIAYNNSKLMIRPRGVNLRLSEEERKVYVSKLPFELYRESIYETVFKDSVCRMDTVEFFKHIDSLSAKIEIVQSWDNIIYDIRSSDVDAIIGLRYDSRFAAGILKLGGQVYDITVLNDDNSLLEDLMYVLVRLKKINIIN